MEQNWNSVGKRMPYSLPEGFFEANEAALMARVQQEAQETAQRPTRKGVMMRLPLWMGGAVAAMLAVGVLFWMPREESVLTSGDLLYAYHDGMSSEELESWIEFYEADLFVSYE